MADNCGRNLVISTNSASPISGMLWPDASLAVLIFSTKDVGGLGGASAAAADRMTVSPAEIIRLSRADVEALSTTHIYMASGIRRIAVDKEMVIQQRLQLQDVDEKTKLIRPIDAGQHQMPVFQLWRPWLSDLLHGTHGVRPGKLCCATAALTSVRVSTAESERLLLYRQNVACDMSGSCGLMGVDRADHGQHTLSLHCLHGTSGECVQLEITGDHTPRPSLTIPADVTLLLALTFPCSMRASRAGQQITAVHFLLSCGNDCEFLGKRENIPVKTSKHTQPAKHKQDKQTSQAG